mmetsp:Transcript_68483/g.198650  ORF Transcript_68483/g.198650 Transcript_68483/m.198650 type:complete len:248 (+) Transcript_68483:126-869(+)
MLLPAPRRPRPSEGWRSDAIMVSGGGGDRSPLSGCTELGPGARLAAVAEFHSQLQPQAGVALFSRRRLCPHTMQRARSRRPCGQVTLTQSRVERILRRAASSAAEPVPEGVEHRGWPRIAGGRGSHAAEDRGRPYLGSLSARRQRGENWLVVVAQAAGCSAAPAAAADLRDLFGRLREARELEVRPRVLRRVHPPLAAADAEVPHVPAVPWQPRAPSLAGVLAAIFPSPDLDHIRRGVHPRHRCERP